MSDEVEDNWKALTEPQRFNILKAKEPVVQILKSFQRLLDGLEKVEKMTEGSRVESQLNSLDISPLETMREWIRYWDTIRKYVGQISQLFSHFRAFVHKPDTSSKVSLGEFVSSLVETRVQETSVDSMLSTFHSLVIRQDKGSSLFAFLEQIFSEVFNQENGVSHNP